ncbi:hypothetical protein B296_00006476 [Ensete ventricosum]|uniref:Uncharacterized protein n=1 Tax=Ensete ventricosum TaxID=4639 RepID=A0A427AWD6_ENSVE|nr:hypothetical protein B296_00006476 [Ensete ventricosum]
MATSRPSNPERPRVNHRWLLAPYVLVGVDREDIKPPVVSPFLRSSIKMDSFSRGGTLIVDTSCGFYVYGLRCEKSHVEKEECACWKIEDTANIAFHGISSVPLVSETDGLMVQDTAGAPAMICPVGDIQGHFSSSNATSDEEATSNLISAMKGSRAQNGSPPNVKLHVRWAPEVYDPPCTLMSHTVKKSYYHRHKAKKKDRNKHKHRGKSTRGSSSERRIPTRSSVTNMAEPVDTRFILD